MWKFFDYMKVIIEQDDGVNVPSNVYVEVPSEFIVTF
jgi:hypothetical protein